MFARLRTVLHTRFFPPYSQVEVWLLDLDNPGDLYVHSRRDCASMIAAAAALGWLEAQAKGEDLVDRLRFAPVLASSWGGRSKLSLRLRYLRLYQSRLLLDFDLWDLC